MALIEQDVEGEREVSRHILRKVTEAETTMLDVRADMAGLRKDLTERLASRENQIVGLRADLPRIIAEAVGAVMRGSNTAQEDYIPAFLGGHFLPVCPAFRAYHAA